jgi:hypothetical protein
MLSTTKPNIISSHAEYRRGDYLFARALSRRMRELEWEHREAPLHSWMQVLFPALGVLTAAAAALEILH